MNEKLEVEVTNLAAAAACDLRQIAIGITKAGRKIWALVEQDEDRATESKRALLVGGLSGSSADVSLAMRAVRYLSGAGRRPAVALHAVPCANPGGLALRVGPANGAGGRVDRGYPPVTGFFNHPTSPEVRYLWRWVCYQAPDVVFEIRHGSATAWEINAAAGAFREALGAQSAAGDDSLISAIGDRTRAAPGTIPGFRLTADEYSIEAEIDRIFDLLIAHPPGPSHARQVLRARSARDPFEVGRDLARANGRTLDPFNYTQGVAISGRLRLALLDPTAADGVSDAASLVEPTVAHPARALGADPGAPGLATIVWAEEMKELTADPRYGHMLKSAMHVFKYRGPRKPPFPLDSDFIAEDHFFASAVIGRGAHIDTDSNTAGYVNELTRFILEAGIQEESGLFRHSRHGPVHWGRGNGFAAMGLAEYLTYIPARWRSDEGEIESKFRRHMAALRPLQQPSGMYLQVLDCPGSYQELTATCMIGYAMARGIRLGVLDQSFRGPVDHAWRAASERIDTAGNVVDGCASTGVMDGLQSYLDRPANSGYDDRTGAMALWFAAEIARLNSEDGG